MRKPVISTFFLYMYVSVQSKVKKKKKKDLVNMSQVTGLHQSYGPPGGQKSDGKVHFEGRGFSALR